MLGWGGPAWSALVGGCRSMNAGVIENQVVEEVEEEESRIAECVVGGSSAGNIARRFLTRESQYDPIRGAACCQVQSLRNAHVTI